MPSALISIRRSDNPSDRDLHIVHLHNDNIVIMTFTAVLRGQTTALSKADVGKCLISDGLFALSQYHFIPVYGEVVPARLLWSGLGQGVPV